MRKKHPATLLETPPKSSNSKTAIGKSSRRRKKAQIGVGRFVSELQKQQFDKCLFAVKAEAAAASILYFRHMEESLAPRMELQNEPYSVYYSESRNGMDGLHV